jgi:hypothetical protein
MKPGQLKRTGPPKRKTELRRDTEKERAFVENGRRSSAESLQESGRSSARKHQREGGGFHASYEQRRAVDGMVCLACHRPRTDSRAIDPAHIWPRGRGGCSEALCVIPLCRTLDGGCHRLFDEGKLDLLRIIAQPDKWEQWRAQCQHALEHCTPNELVERLSGARTQWSDAT